MDGRPEPGTDDPCPFAPMVDLVFPRWTSHVLWVLVTHGRMRFSELRDRVPGVSPKVLTERLRRLERDGLVSRHQYAEIPPRVEYEVTELARSLVPLFQTLSRWADEHLDEVERARRHFDARAAGGGQTPPGRSGAAPSSGRRAGPARSPRAAPPPRP